MNRSLSRVMTVLLLAGLGAGPLQAQAAVVHPDRELNAEEAALRSAMYQFRDTVAALAGINSRMQRDFAATSSAALVSRARQVKLACDATARNISPAVAAVKAAPVTTKFQVQAQSRLLDAYKQLGESVTSCSTSFGEMVAQASGDRIRGYGNARLEALNRDILHYSASADDFFRTLSIPNRPLGSKANPLIG